MSNYASLERYIPLVEFMGKICGKNYEIILHDVSTPERSVIAACNEHLSGRRVGDPMTELAKELLRTGAYKEHDYVANYEGRTRGGNRFVFLLPGGFRSARSHGKHHENAEYERQTFLHVSTFCASP